MSGLFGGAPKPPKLPPPPKETDTEVVDIQRRERRRIRAGRGSRSTLLAGKQEFKTKSLLGGDSSRGGGTV